MASKADDDLTASKTEGYKAGEKKTVEEYAKLGRSHRSSIKSRQSFIGRPQESTTHLIANLPLNRLYIL